MTKRATVLLIGLVIFLDAGLLLRWFEPPPPVVNLYGLHDKPEEPIDWQKKDPEPRLYESIAGKRAHDSRVLIFGQ